MRQTQELLRRVRATAVQEKLGQLQAADGQPERPAQAGERVDRQLEFPVGPLQVVAPLEEPGRPAVDQGILGRLSTTPARLLGAGRIVFFGVNAPKNPGGLILAVVLSIAARLRSAWRSRRWPGPREPRAALWRRRSTRSCSSRLVLSGTAPAGHAAVHQPLHAARRGGAGDAGFDERGLPPAALLLVLTAYALVFGFSAECFFRWE